MADVELKSITPAVVNDEALSMRVQELVRELFPEDILSTDVRTMGSEDMAFMMDEIPGCYMFIGSNNAEIGLDFGHHHPKFDFDERALVKGTALMAAVVMDILK